MATESKADYARRHGVSKARVSQWVGTGLIVLSEGKVDVEASDAKLAMYRDTTDGRAKKSNDGVKRKTVKRNALNSKPTVKEDETTEEAAERILTETGAQMPIEEAKRVKENYLALLNQLEYDQKSGAVVAVAEVAKAVGEEYARVRTRLLAIPAERAPDIHRLKTVTEVQDALQEMIVQALEELTRDGAGSPK
jgi:hypothetical protein